MEETQKRGRGRPRGRTQTELIRFLLTPDELAELDSFRGNRSRSEAIREALALWMKKQWRSS